VRSPRNSAAATSRFVRPSATRVATRRSAAVSPSWRLRPAIRPSSPRAFATQLDGVARRALLAAATPDDAERQECPRAAKRVGDCFMLGDRLLEQGQRLLDVAASCGHETAASQHMREHPLTPEPGRVRLPDVEDSNGIVDPAELK